MNRVNNGRGYVVVRIPYEAEQREGEELTVVRRFAGFSSEAEVLQWYAAHPEEAADDFEWPANAPDARRGWSRVTEMLHDGGDASEGEPFAAADDAEAGGSAAGGLRAAMAAAKDGGADWLRAWLLSRAGCDVSWSMLDTASLIHAHYAAGRMMRTPRGAPTVKCA